MAKIEIQDDNFNMQSFTHCVYNCKVSTSPNFCTSLQFKEIFGPKYRAVAVMTLPYKGAGTKHCICINRDCQTQIRKYLISLINIELVMANQLTWHKFPASKLQ